MVVVNNLKQIVVSQNTQHKHMMTDLTGADKVTCWTEKPTSSGCDRRRPLPRLYLCNLLTASILQIKLINNLLWFLSVGDVLGGVKVGRDLLSMSLAMVVGL